MATSSPVGVKGENYFSFIFTYPALEPDLVSGCGSIEHLNE